MDRAANAEPAGTPTLVDQALAFVSSRTFPLYGELVAIYVVFRAGGFSNVPIVVTDTPSYEETAAHALWSVDFLGGERPFMVPLLYKVFETPESRIVAQLVVSTLCWLVLAAAVARSLRHPVVRPLAFAAVLAFSLIREVTVWDTTLLSESLTFSLVALVLAAWLSLLRNPTPLHAGLALAAMLLWTFSRDSNAYVVLAVAVLVAVSLIDERRRRLKLGLAVGCVAIFGASFASAESGQRWLLPVKDVVFKRVLETPDMKAYFAAQGHPVEGNWTLTPWLERARGVYAGYLLRHPGYTLTAPFHGRQEALYSTPDNRTALFAPDLALYNTNEGLGFLRPPRTLSAIFFPRDLTTLFVALGAIVLLAAVVAVRAGPPVVWVVPAGLLLTTYPHMLAAWHFSGYEVDRHALQAALLLRLAALLLLLFALDRAVSAWRGRRRAT